MVILRIREKGHYLELPGMNPVRTPVEIDITRLSLPIVAAKLLSMGISDWEIVSETGTGDKKIYKKDDFLPKTEKKDTSFTEFLKFIDKRFKRFENAIKEIERRVQEKDKTDKEQNSVKHSLERLETLIKGIKPTQITIDEFKTAQESKKKFEDDTETFIPEITTDSLRMSGEASLDKHKRSEDTESLADALSQMTKRRKKP
jgi:hypothetical protein